MNMHVVPKEGTPPVVEKKYRTITLTNRAPVRIVEDDWPAIAEGKCGDDFEDAPWGWKLEIRVRRHTKNTSGWTHIVHANYVAWDESNESLRPGCNQRVRVGRLLIRDEAAMHLDKHILEVGEELRTRIALDDLRKYVVHAIDDCFASFSPVTVG